MSCEDRVEPEICPECGSRLAVEHRAHDGLSVTIAVCTGFPNCTYFRWSVPESDGNPGNPSAFGGVGSWAIDESLNVLRDERSPQEWREALASLEGPPEEGGGARRG